MGYLKVWLMFLKMSWMADLEYRMNAVVKIFGETCWYLAQISIFEVLYIHKTDIAGWDVHAMRVFMATLFLTDVLFYLLVLEGIEGLASMVRRGDLDLYLVKPINSQFMISTRKVSTAFTVNVVAILAYMVWAVRGLPHPVSAWQLTTFALLFLCGLFMQYAMRFMFVTWTIILQDAGNINFIWHQLYRMATRPDPFFPFYMRVFIFTVFPVAFFASVPSRMVVEGADGRFISSALALAAFTLWLSTRFWNYALKHYSSASS